MSSGLQGLCPDLSSQHPAQGPACGRGSLSEGLSRKQSSVRQQRQHFGGQAHASARSRLKGGLCEPTWQRHFPTWLPGEVPLAHLLKSSLASAEAFRVCSTSAKASGLGLGHGMCHLRTGRSLSGLTLPASKCLLGHTNQAFSEKLSPMTASTSGALAVCPELALDLTHINPFSLPIHPLRDVRAMVLSPF